MSGADGIGATRVWNARIWGFNALMVLAHEAGVAIGVDLRVKDGVHPGRYLSLYLHIYRVGGVPSKYQDCYFQCLSQFTSSSVAALDRGIQIVC